MISPRLRAALPIALAILAAAHLVRSARPAWNELQSDFPNLYVAARLVQAGGDPFDLYDLERFQAWARRCGIENRLVVFQHYAPLSAWPLLPLAAVQDPLIAQRCWLIANLLFAALAVWILARLANRPWIEAALLLLVSGLALGNNLRLGQVYLLLMLLIAAGYHALRHGRDLAAALLWGAALALKPYPLLLIVYPLWRRRWRALLWCVVAFTAVLATSVLLLGWELHAYYAREILPDSLRGLVVDPFSAYSPTFTTLAHRLFLKEPQLNPFPFADRSRLAAIGPPLIGALLWILVLARTPQRGRREDPGARRGFALFALLPLLLAPVVSTYTLILLLPSAALAWGEAARRGKLGRCGLVLLAVGLIGLDWVPFGLELRPRLGTPILFLRLVLLLAFATLLWAWSRPVRRSRQARWPIVAVSAASLLPAILTPDPFPANPDAARPLAVAAPPLAQLHPTDLDGRLIFLASSPSGLFWRSAADPRPLPDPRTGPPNRAVARSGGAPAGEQTVSPDGRYTAFSAWRAGNWDLFLRRAPNGPTRRLTRDPGRDRQPLWIDDHTLVFASDRRRGIGFASLYVLDLADPLGPGGSGPIGLTPREDDRYKRP